jgi:hypothetical protein
MVRQIIQTIYHSRPIRVNNIKPSFSDDGPKLRRNHFDTSIAHCLALFKKCKGVFDFIDWAWPKAKRMIDRVI